MNEMTRELNPYTDLDCEHNDVCEEELQTNLRKDFTITITESLLLIDSAYTSTFTFQRLLNLGKVWFA